jgi:aspartyl-tRNA synthetase
MHIAEGITTSVFQDVLGVELEKPFPLLSYKEAMEKYGTDKPDLRLKLVIQPFDDLARKSNFHAFRSVLNNGGVVYALPVPSGGEFSRKIMNGLNQHAVSLGAKGLAWVKVKEKGFEGGISKFFPENVQTDIIRSFKCHHGDAILFIADEWEKALTALGGIRLEVGKHLALFNQNIYQPVWIAEFPLLEWDIQDERWTARHHPFTSPLPEDIPFMRTSPGKVRARAYDLVVNGHEIAGGSIRIHNRELQQEVFQMLGISEEEAEQKFGFLLDAFRFGAPPHGGIAFGFDRLVMILAGVESIREVIAFPKTTSALSLMDGSHTTVEKKQLEELGIRLIKQKKKR